MATKIPTEKETRAELLGWARKYGAESDLLKIFARYDNILRGAKNEAEARSIKAMGILEIRQFFNKNDNENLLLNGKTIEEFLTGKKNK